MVNISQELETELIKRRAVSGVVTLTLRTIFVQIFTFFGTFMLTILLSPEIFGIFFVVSAILNFFVYFSDIGLAAALVQKKDEPTRQDLVSTFTIQQAIIFFLLFIGLIFSSKIAQFYNLDKEGLLLLRVLIFSLVLSSLKTIPSIILERKLNFTRLILPHIAENLIFYSVAIILAYLNFGISAFSWAVLARGFIGLILIYILSPWKPGIGINLENARKLISFGIPFQTNSLLALAKDDLLTIFLGKILSFAQIGYVGWAQKWSLLPIRFVVDNVNKVTFPAYSRLQSQKYELGKAIEKSLFFVTYLAYPSIFGIIAVAPKLLEVIPRYQKWEPALPLLYLFAINAVFSAVSTTFTNTLFALGKPKIVLNFMILWTSATWILTYPLVLIYGYIGVGIASALVAMTSIATIYFVKKEVKITVGRNIFGPLLISSLMCLIVRLITSTYVSNIVGLALTIILGAFIYLALSISILRKHLLEDAKIIVKALIFNK